MERKQESEVQCYTIILKLKKRERSFVYAFLYVVITTHRMKNQKIKQQNEQKTLKHSNSQCCVYYDEVKDTWFFDVLYL